MPGLRREASDQERGLRVVKIINELVQVKDLKVGDLAWGLPVGLQFATVARQEMEVAESTAVGSVQQALGVRVTLMVVDGAEAPEEWLRESNCYRLTIEK